MASIFPHNLRRVHYVVIVTVLLAILLIFSLNEIKSTPIELELGEEITFKPTPPLKTKLIDLNFKYLLTPEPCPKNQTLAIIIVTSHYNNVETRSAMRRAFTTQDLASLGLKRVFLLGESPDSIYMNQAALINENQRFKDIVQGSFKEAYRNLTYKHIMGLKWVSEYCKHTRYVIKMDDDIVINVGKTVTLLHQLSLPSDSIAGYVLRDLTPKRDRANKWYVTKDEYKFSKYPSFVSGWWYLTRVEVASRLALLSHYFRYFWIDDVYVTGILAQNLKIKLVDLRKHFTVFPEFLQCCIADSKKKLDCDILVGPNGGDNNMFFEFNEAMKKCERCGKRVKPINETCVAEKKVNLQRGSGVVENYKLH